MTGRSILPRFMRGARSRLSALPPTPPIDRDEAEGVSLFALARLAEEAAQ